MSQIPETALEILTAKLYQANGINHPQCSRRWLAAELREQMLGFAHLRAWKKHQLLSFTYQSLIQEQTVVLER